MLSILLAIAATVSIASTAIAWICDSLTKEQTARHDELRRQNARSRSDYEGRQLQHAEYSANTEREYALELKAMFSQQCQSYMEASDPIHLDLTDLRVDLARQLGLDHLSPYRRNALKQLWNRLDDALNRLVAYRAYGDWYQAQLNKLEKDGAYKDLIALDLPEPKLPADWFYVGKVGLVERDELNKNQNRFNQVLQLMQVCEDKTYAPDPLALELAQSYPDQEAIPIQIFTTNKSAHFFSACVLRGMIHVDHILEQVPCKAVVEKMQGQDYLVRCFPAFYELRRDRVPQGGVVAMLPRSEARYPGKTYQVGDQLEVFPLHYDLLLSVRQITVTERVDSLDFERESVAPVYFCIDQEHPELAALANELEGDATWSLHSCHELSLGILQINFQLGGWFVRTTSSPNEASLTVIAIDAADVHSLEKTTVPFELQLIERAFIGDIFIDGQQCRLLQNFCLQQQSYEQRGAERELAWQFFARWNKVADYLLETDGHLCVELSPLEGLEGSAITAACDAEAELQMKALLEQVEKESERRGRMRLRLEQACLDAGGAQVWLQVAELETSPVKEKNQYRLDVGQRALQGLQVVRFGFTPVQPPRLRLRDRKRGDYQNLIRQKQALEAFVLDKLLNKSIKQILVDPASYRSEPDPHWQEKIANGLIWKNEKWRDAACGCSAKVVIENALAESNLYQIQGPPGTGKTTCIVELLHQLYADNPALRVLVVSQQNTAVDNALTRFLKESPEYGEEVLRVGNIEKIDVQLQSCSSDQRLRAYYDERVGAFQNAAATERSQQALLQDWIGSIRDVDLKFDPELSELLIGEYKLVGATCVGLAGQRHGLHRLQFDLAIIDEAGRSTVPELLIPILRSRKIILIGDHFQLPPSIAATLREEDSLAALPFLEEAFLKESFFEMLFRALPSHCRGRLTEQFRMVDPIGDLVADLFYQVDGERGLFNGKSHDKKDFLEPGTCLLWEDIHGVQESDGTSKLNKAEALAITEYLKCTRVWLDERKVHKDIAIITPYGAQKRLIRHLLDKLAVDPATDRAPHRLGEYLTAKVDTVDGFQGSEADIVLYSTVRTKGDISFIRDRQRLNVACSRARENLIFFGDASFLKRAEKLPTYEHTTGLFTEIIRRSVLKLTWPSGLFFVTIYHIPKPKSQFVFAKRDDEQYIIHVKVTVNATEPEWYNLEIGDELAITAAITQATSARILPKRAAQVRTGYSM